MIKVRDLSFSYPGTATPIIDQLTFDIADGEVFGMLGPSGVGKSTTQKILMGLLRGFTGTAELFGTPIQSIDRSFYERIGVSFELPTLYLRLTALENLHLFAALYTSPGRRPEEVLELVDLTGAADQRVDTFSKGMKMRLNLARALLHDPQLLFLDEPTTGQDPARARMTRNLIRTLKDEGKTIFLTTHNMAEADEICDRVGFLAGGNIAVSGAPEDLKRRYGHRALDVTVETPTGQAKHTFPMDDIGTNTKFSELLATSTIISMHTMEASLDDVFIRATNGETKT